MCTYSIRVITDEKEWEFIEREWNTLLTRSNYNDIFLTYEWLKTWWGIFGNGELSIIIMERNGKIISIIPLYISKVGLIKILRFIGTVESDYGCFIIDHNYDTAEIYHQAFEFICTNLLWDIIDLQQISEVTSLYHYLDENIGIFTKNKRFDVKFYELDKCFYIPKSEGSFTQNCSKKFYRKIKSRKQKLMRLGDVSCEEIQNIDSKILQCFFETHIKKWRRSGKVSNFAFGKYRKFHSEIMKKFAQNSWLSFLSLKFNDNYIAFKYAFKYNKKIYMYIPTYDPDFAIYGPGHLAFLYYLNLVENYEISEVDLLRGEETYKLDWAKKYRMNHRFILSKKNVKGIIYKFYILLMDRLYHANHFRGTIRYLYKVLRQCKLLFQTPPQ